MQKKIKKLAVVMLLCFFLTGCQKETPLSASWEETQSGEQDAGSDQEDSLSLQEDEGIKGTSESGGVPGGSQEAGTQESMIYVQILGEVNHPGVYAVPEGSRVFQVIDEAGGFTRAACIESVNQAAVLSDEQQIYVYSEEEAKKLQEEGDFFLAGESKTPETGKVDLNTADKEQLMTLPGIGESKAESIINYREKSGKFSSIEDVMKVDGIKEGVYNKIKDQITV